MQSGSTASVNLGFGFAGFGISGLILGQFFGHIISSAVLVKLVIVEDNYLFFKIKKANIIALLKRYISFLKFGTLALFTSNI